MRAAILASLTATLVATQDQPPPATFRTEANYVRVDVYATQDGVALSDLTRTDFEVLEDRVPQRIEQFERVAIRPAGAQETRIEPNNVRDMRSMLENSRARVFVLFLDTYHVEIEGSHNIRRPLVDALDHVIGSDDLVGVMKPDMSATDIAFASSGPDADTTDQLYRPHGIGHPARSTHREVDCTRRHSRRRQFCRV